MSKDHSPFPWSYEWIPGLNTPIIVDAKGEWVAAVYDHGQPKEHIQANVDVILLASSGIFQEIQVLLEDLKDGAELIDNLLQLKQLFEQVRIEEGKPPPSALKPRIDNLLETINKIL